MLSGVVWLVVPLCQNLANNFVHLAVVPTRTSEAYVRAAHGPVI
jgi:hypothetical protein